MSVFQKIVNISNEEDAMRKEIKKVKEVEINRVVMKSLEYEKADFDKHMVINGYKNRETVTKENFNMEFSKKTHDLLTYFDWDNVVVAGGSLVNIITKSAEPVSDVDLFIYGLDKEQTKLKIDHIIHSIKQKAITMKFETRVYMNNNVINIYVFETRKLLQLQIILRLYDTLTHVLVGFDVDCCCVAYNGKDVLSTPRGEAALKYRVNVANLQRRSPSYESRLIKYSLRGFDVITNFDYKEKYNKMFFMHAEKRGFPRLLEQQLINNGQLKKIIFSNTLRFKKTASYVHNAWSNYSCHNLEIRDVRQTESCITKHNANIEDEKLKFKEYNIKNVEIMEINVIEQFTGSFCPITNEEWIDSTPDSVCSTELDNEITKTNLKGTKCAKSRTLMPDLGTKFSKKALGNKYIGKKKKTMRSNKIEDEKKDGKYEDEDGDAKKEEEDEQEEEEEEEEEEKNDKSGKIDDAEEKKKGNESKCTGDLIEKLQNDPLGRSEDYLRLKYNLYSDVSEFENKTITDISNFGIKSLAIMYWNNDEHIRRVLKNYNIEEKRNLYKINLLNLAILLGKTKIAMHLMQASDNVKELIYMMDNDKLFARYCNMTGQMCTQVDKALVAKYRCVNISDNIHQQNKDTGLLERFYAQDDFTKIMCISASSSFNGSCPRTKMSILAKTGTATGTAAGAGTAVGIQTVAGMGVEKICAVERKIMDVSVLQSMDITKLSFDVIKMLYERKIFVGEEFDKYIIKDFKEEDVKKFSELMETACEKSLFEYVLFAFRTKQNHRCLETHKKLKKLMIMKNTWNDELSTASVAEEFKKAFKQHENLYACMLHIRHPDMTRESIKALIGLSDKSFDKVINYVLYLNDVELLQRFIPADDMYIKLKYSYFIESRTECPRILEFFKRISCCRESNKIKTNQLLKNTEYHITALNDGDLPVHYERVENVFGMTPDDNIISKLLLLYNKVFNKREEMNDKDLTTLANMRKAVHLFKRNKSYNPVDRDYLYSMDLHNLFFENNKSIDVGNHDRHQDQDQDQEQEQDQYQEHDQHEEQDGNVERMNSELHK